MQFKRLELNIGKNNVLSLHNKTVLVIGCGGVGGYCVEALARSGIGTLILVDFDVVDITNLNRQVIALHSTIGKPKVKLLKERILDIYPKCNVVTYEQFFDDILAKEIKQSYTIDFIVDACDTISAKFAIINFALHYNIKFICAMGAGNRRNPTKLRISRLEKTNYDPLAKVLRKKVKDSKLKGIIPVVFSDEKPFQIKEETVGNTRKQKFPVSSNAFTPSVSGLICAAFVVNSLINNKYCWN